MLLLQLVSYCLGIGLIITGYYTNKKKPSNKNIFHDNQLFDSCFLELNLLFCWPMLKWFSNFQLKYLQLKH